MSLKTLSCCVVMWLNCVACFGQAGVSSSSVGLSRAGISRTTPEGRFRMPPPNYFRVEEFINYHRHDLPTPQKGQRVHLDLKQMVVGKHRSVIQVGITTPRALAPGKIRPLNVVLVIDQSGSMSGDRIAKVKQSILAFVERFRSTDKVSIVGFSTKARVLLEACEKSDQQRIEKAIQQIVADGSTNLHGGLMLGYQLARKHYDAERTNRVIFLTDGNANVGVVDPAEIARQSKAYNVEGISLSTIGLGQNFNHALLRNLADAGKGLLHFVKDSKDIQKIFVTEIDSLLAPAARKITLQVKFKGNPKVKVFGYSPTCEQNKFVFELDDLNHGATQVVLFEVDCAGLPKAVAKIEYIDAITGKQESLKVKSSSNVLVSSESPVSIRRNYAIGLVAESLKKSATDSNQGNCRKAERALHAGLEAACKQVPHRDPDLERVLEIAKNYRAKILDCIERFGD